MSDTVLHRTCRNVAVLTLNRPAKLNALDYELIDRLMELLNAIERDNAVRVVILTGAGDKAFSSGADIAGFAPSVRQGEQVALREFVRRGQQMTARIETFPKPIIVAVNGLAHGGGCEITEAAPLAIASERAEFLQGRDHAWIRAAVRRLAATAAPGRPQARAADDAHRRADQRSEGPRLRADQCGRPA